MGACLARSLVVFADAGAGAYPPPNCWRSAITLFT
jgi:hypothetical protein